MGAKIQGRGVSGTPVKFTGYLKNFPASAEAIRNAPGKLQTTCFIISEPSETFKQPVSSFPSPRKPSNNLFRHFRALGNLQTTCFVISEPSETFKQLVSSFPSPRKPSNNLFHHFRGLGASTEAGEVCSVRAFEVPGQLPSLGRGRRPPKKRFAFTFARPQEERHRSV